MSSFDLYWQEAQTHLTYLHAIKTLINIIYKMSKFFVLKGNKMITVELTLIIMFT